MRCNGECLRVYTYVECMSEFVWTSVLACTGICDNTYYVSCIVQVLSVRVRSFHMAKDILIIYACYVRILST